MEVRWSSLESCLFWVQLPVHPFTRSRLINTVHRTARLIPPVTHRGDRTETAGDDEMQPVYILHGLDRVIVVIRIDSHRTRALRAPVAAAFEVPLRPFGKF